MGDRCAPPHRVHIHIVREKDCEGESDARNSGVVSSRVGAGSVQGRELLCRVGAGSFALSAPYRGRLGRSREENGFLSDRQTGAQYKSAPARDGTDCHACTRVSACRWTTTHSSSKTRSRPMAPSSITRKLLHNTSTGFTAARRSCSHKGEPLVRQPAPFPSLTPMLRLHPMTGRQGEGVCLGSSQP